MSSGAQRFTRRVIAAFEAAGHYTDREIADAGGPSTTTLTKWRKVAAGELSDMAAPRTDTLERTDAAARWMPGSARALWALGREPRPLAGRDGLREALGLPEPLSPHELSSRVRDIERRLEALEEAGSTEAWAARHGGDPSRGPNGETPDP